MSDIFNYFKEKNVVIGITINILATFLVYILTISFYTGYFLYADLQFVLGGILGIFFTLKYRKKDKSIMKYAIITGIIGGFLTSFFIALYETILFILTVGANVEVFFGFLIILSLSGATIGLLIGLILSVYFMYKETKGEEGKEHDIKNDFFQDLIEDN